MFAAQISFPKGHRGANDASEAALEMLSYWLKNGQIVGDDWTLTDTGDTIAAYVTIPERASLRPARNNRYVSDGLAAAVLTRPFVGVTIHGSPIARPRNAAVCYNGVARQPREIVNGNQQMQEEPDGSPPLVHRVQRLQELHRLLGQTASEELEEEAVAMNRHRSTGISR